MAWDDDSPIGFRYVESNTGTRHLGTDDDKKEALCGFVNPTFPIRKGSTAVETCNSMCENCRQVATTHHQDKLMVLYEIADEHEHGGGVGLIDAE